MFTAKWRSHLRGFGWFTRPPVHQAFAEVLTIISQGDAIMATLADIKTKLDALSDSEAKLEAFARSSQTDLASVQSKLDAALASGADPTLIASIADEITQMQAGVEAALPAAPVLPTPPAPPAPAPADPAPAA